MILIGNDTCSKSSQSLKKDNACFDALNRALLNYCPLDNGNNIEILKDEEIKVIQLQQGLQLIEASKSCTEEVIPFLCQYLYGLCSDSGHLIQPSSTQCETLQNSICQREWEVALQFGLELPNCNNLSSQVSCSSTVNDQEFLVENFTFGMALLLHVITRILQNYFTTVFPVYRARYFVYKIIMEIATPFYFCSGF